MKHTDLNQIVAVDYPDINGVNYQYEIWAKNSIEEIATIKFQKGSIENNSSNGCFVEDLLVLARDQLLAHQQSSCQSNRYTQAILAIEAALTALDC